MEFRCLCNAGRWKRRGGRGKDGEKMDRECKRRVYKGQKREEWRKETLEGGGEKRWERQLVIPKGSYRHQRCPGHGSLCACDPWLPQTGSAKSHPCYASYHPYGSSNRASVATEEMSAIFQGSHSLG